MHTRFKKWFGSRERDRGHTNLVRTGRRACFETLESRQLLSITLPTISNVSLAAGATVYVPLAGSNGNNTSHAVTYAVTASDYSKLSTVMMP